MTLDNPMIEINTEFTETQLKELDEIVTQIQQLTTYQSQSPNVKKNGDCSLMRSVVFNASQCVLENNGWDDKEIIHVG